MESFSPTASTLRCNPPLDLGIGSSVLENHVQSLVGYQFNAGFAVLTYRIRKILEFRSPANMLVRHEILN